MFVVFCVVSIESSNRHCENFIPPMQSLLIYVMQYLTEVGSTQASYQVSRLLINKYIVGPYTGRKPHYVKQPR